MEISKNTNTIIPPWNMSLHKLSSSEIKKLFEGDCSNGTTHSIILAALFIIWLSFWFFDAYELVSEIEKTIWTILAYCRLDVQIRQQGLGVRDEIVGLNLAQQEERGKWSHEAFVRLWRTRACLGIEHIRDETVDDLLARFDHVFAAYGLRFLIVFSLSGRCRRHRRRTSVFQLIFD